MEKILSIISPIIGLLSAIIVAILSGGIQLIIAKKNREIQEKQLLESNKQFLIQMEKSKKEYDNKFVQLWNEQRNSNIDVAQELLQSETNRFFTDLKKEIIFYGYLSNELHYLSHITNPQDQQFRIKGAYPFIEDNIKNMIGDVSLHQNIAVHIGDLRAKISLYNIAQTQGVDSNVLEELLNRVYKLIPTITTEMVINYNNAQQNIRKHEVQIAEQIIKNKVNIQNPYENNEE